MFIGLIIVLAGCTKEQNQSGNIEQEYPKTSLNNIELKTEENIKKEDNVEEKIEIDTKIEEDDVVETKTYTDLELLTLENHPKVFDKLQDAQDFYSNINNDKICVSELQKHFYIKRNIKSKEDEALLYITEHSTDKGYIGTVEMNLISPEICNDMTAEKAIQLLIDYLPENFGKYYKKDASFKTDSEPDIDYVIAFRLNEKGEKFQEDGNEQYPYYYSLIVSHNAEENYWKLQTDYSAYGGRSVGWIRNYAIDWNPKLSI